MSNSAAFHLTRRAAQDLRDIFDYSRREWGEATANRYMADLYEAMSNAAENPDSGIVLRKHRTAPFLTVSVRQHFVVYDCVPQGIAILTVQHQVRDIESLIANLTPAFLQEVDQIKIWHSTDAPKRGGKRKRE